MRNLSARSSRNPQGEHVRARCRAPPSKWRPQLWAPLLQLAAVQTSLWPPGCFPAASQWPAGPECICLLPPVASSLGPPLSHHSPLVPAYRGLPAPSTGSLEERAPQRRLPRHARGKHPESTGAQASQDVTWDPGGYTRLNPGMQAWGTYTSSNKQTPERAPVVWNVLKHRACDERGSRCRKTSPTWPALFRERLPW